MKDDKLGVGQILGILLIYLAIQTPISALINNPEIFSFTLFILLFLSIFGIILIWYSKQ